MIYIKHFKFLDYLENTYIVFNSAKEAFIVDPGCYYDYENSAIVDTINELDLKIQGVLVTHAHIDHILGVEFLQQTYQVPIFIHEKEFKILKNMPKIGKELGYDIPEYSGKVLFVDEGNLIHLGEVSFQIIYTPGHTQNSISFYNQAFNSIFSGDVLFYNKIGKVDLPGGNYDQLVNTVKTKLFTLPSDVIVYPGHGSITNIGFEKLNNKFEIWG